MGNRKGQQVTHTHAGYDPTCHQCRTCDWWAGNTPALLGGPVSTTPAVCMDRWADTAPDDTCPAYADDTLVQATRRAASAVWHAQRQALGLPALGAG